MEPQAQDEPQTQDKDRSMLHALGYAQELSRRMSGFSNFAISFTIISILSGTFTLYYRGSTTAGSVEEAYGWPIVSVFVIIVGLGDGGDRVQVPDRGRPVLLGRRRWAARAGAGSRAGST